MDVVVNVAMSADGKLSTRNREQIAISGPSDFARVERLRSTVDAIMVGVGTVLADDPHLTVDDETLRRRRVDREMSEQPTRVIADSRARTPLDARILDRLAPTVVLVSEDAPADRVGALRDNSATVSVVGADRVDLPAGLSILEKQEIDRLLVEGGGELVFSFFEAGLVTELSTFVGDFVIGGRDAPTPVDGSGFETPDRFPPLTLQSVDRFDGGVLLQWAVRQTSDG